MDALLTKEQQKQRAEFRSFADEAIAGRADDIDRRQILPAELIQGLAAAGYLAAMIPQEWGGAGLDPVSYGLLSEELGRACQNVRNFVAVDDMVAHSIWRWGTEAQRQRWLHGIAGGTIVGAFALTEPGIGSDAKNVTTTAAEAGSDIVLDGHKKWISFGQIADVFLVFAKFQGKHTAFLVPRESAGLRIEPIRDLLGLRGSMLGELFFDGCRIPAADMVGRPGMGLTFVASSALDIGRFSTACGCVGLAQACLEDSVRYADRREQYETPIKNHQLVQRMLADMLVNTGAARLMCYHAAVAKSQGDPDAVNKTLMAKYFASVAVNRAAADAVQIHGAQGIGAESSVQRYLRDAKVMEIIEGTTQIHQTILGHYSATAAI
ncbi:MAG TPA: acyl-CoA dehydrogenase family protein [Candidatus Limnocylindrales bacterium]|nr:acyl-CoA dehydrogenase family protein [Candidatus Limnocylindrales bacterium]